jgi:hypothetical protein
VLGVFGGGGFAGAYEPRIVLSSSSLSLLLL